MNVFSSAAFVFSIALFAAFCPLNESKAQARQEVGTIAGGFDVTLSGSAIYNIPIRVAPGSAGTEPKVALSYDSQSPGGTLGAGWSVAGLSAITRGPRSLYFDGLVDGVRLEDSDALFLDGQRLVPIAVSGSGDARRIEYRKEVDDQSQIVQFGADFGSSRFIARTKGGLILVFNGEGKSRISFGAGPTLLQAVSYIFDTAGNYISFEYQNDEDGDYDISSIRYTGRGRVDGTGAVTSERAGFASVEFSYEGASRTIEAYVAGHVLKKKRRLSSITALVTGDLSLPIPSWSQVSKYTLEYEDRPTTANRFVLTKIRQFGEDNTEITPTSFKYSGPDFEWRDDRYSLPQGIAFAHRHELAGAYRFVRVAEQASGVPDLLVAAQVDGQLDAFAYQNKGNGQWDRIDAFKPPFAFTNTDGDDLGALLIDVNGDDRIDLLQSHRPKDAAAVRSAYVAEKDRWLPADQPSLDYRLPFNLSAEGKRVAIVLSGVLASGRKVDLLYESEGQRGFLENTSTGWRSDPNLVPPVSLAPFATLFDVDCDGSPELMAIERDGAGASAWRVFRFSPTGWIPETSSQFQPTSFIPPTINPKALLEVQYSGSTCRGLIASTEENGGFRAAIVASSSGWVSVPDKEPPFDLVTSDGDESSAIVVDVNNDGQVDVIANRALEGKPAVKFAYLQTNTSWSENAAFEPPVLADATPNAQQPLAFVGDLEGDRFPEIVLPAGSEQGLGRVFRGSSNGFTETPDYGPKVPFARADQQDRGIRLLDLNSDGLPDIVYNRDVTNPEKDKDSKGAFINIGRGWLASPGLIPPLAFASDKITGNPVEFVDVDGDGFIDMLYNFRKADNSIVRGFYRNTECDPNVADDTKICAAGREWDPRFDRKWVLQEKSPGVASDLAPPAGYPFAAEGVGDLGVRFLDLDGNGRADILVGYLPPKASSGGNEPVEICKTENGKKICELNRGLFRVAAFLNNGTSWARSQDYDPPVPFVSQEAATGNRTRDLFVQLIDIDGDRLADVVAGFKHPYDNTKDVFETWLNTGHSWRLEANLRLPSMPSGGRLYLDEPLRDRRALVQWADVNSDGLADIVFSKRNGGSNASATFLSTGRGFIEGGQGWKVPIEAIADRDGDPSFRLIDVNGDGLLDIIYSRIVSAGQKEAGVYLNNGSSWITADKKLVERVPGFIDENGLDQGVRLFDVDGNGLLDVLQSFASGAGNTIPAAPVLLNAGRRSDVLTSIDTGYGLVTTIFYQTLLEAIPDRRAVPEATTVAPWDAVYVPGPLAQYPIVSPVPASYVVRRSIVDEGAGRQLAFSYRYGEFRMHGPAMRSLGFGWRESYNEAPESQLLTRTELLQDINFRSSPIREASCWVPLEKLKRPTVSRDFARPSDVFWNNLCPSNIPQPLQAIRKLAESTLSWTLKEGVVGGSNGLPSHTIRQISLARAQTSTFELDGGLVSTQTDTFTYDDTADILKRRQNMLETVTQRGDGTSIRTSNEYAQDDEARWFFGRLTKAVAVKTGDLIQPRANDRYQETRVAEFGYDAITGLLAFEIANAHVPDIAVRTDYTRDQFGNVVSTEVGAVRQPSRITHTIYDPLGRFPTSQINALGHRVQTTPQLTTGAPLSTTGPNGLTTRFEYDGFGRVRKEISPTGIVSLSDMLLPSELHDPEAIASLAVAYATRMQTASLPPTIRLLDNKGRLLRTIAEGFTSDGSSRRSIQRDGIFDILGRPISSTLPYDRGHRIFWETAEYDRLGRLKKTISPNGAATETVYASKKGGGLVTTVIDPLGRRASNETNMRRLPVQVTDSLGGMMHYSYDAGDRLLTIVGPTGATTRHLYDETGQRIETTDPDMGRWKYQYDAFGQLVHQTDAKNQITTIEYDLLGRPVRKALNDATSWWEYDSGARGVGKIASVRGSDGYREDYFYDEFGRQSRWSVTIANETFATFTQFDRLGRIAGTTYPSGLAIENVYDAKGFLTSVRNSNGRATYWNVLNVDEFGRTTAETYGNGLTTARTFEPETGRPQTIYVGQEKEGAVLDLTLKYDLVGNLTSRKEATGVHPGTPISETFEYDALDRLVVMSRSNGARERYAFDAAGRITFKSGVGDYSYAPPITPALAGEDPDAKPFHAVQATKSGGTRDTYGYDLNGNMVRGPTGTFEYTSDNSMKLLFANQARWVRFDYGPTGPRYRQFARTGIEATETLYLGAYERETEYIGPLTDARRGKLTRHRHYLSNSGGIFATVEINGEYSDVLSEMAGVRPSQPKSEIPRSLIETTKVWYLHKDQLGSVIKITDETDRVAAAFWYDPWGKRTVFVRDPNTPRPGKKLDDSWDRGFTGHEHMDGFSLIHMNGRVYNSAISMFTSVDLINQAVFNTQSANAYGYSANNPLRFIDPTGFGWLSDRWEDIKHGASAVGNAIGDAARGIGRGLEDAGKWLSENWRQVVVIAAAVAITVFSGGTLSPIAAAMLSGAVMGAGMAWAYGGTFEDVLVGGFTGAIMGGIGYGVGTSFSAGSWGSIAAEGHLGGMQAAMAGGDYWKGFAVGALTRGVSPNISSVPSTGLRVAARATLSGAVAELEGKKFANGALSGTFAQLYIDSHSYNWSSGLTGGTASFVGGLQSTVRTATGIIGKINALPLTLAGAVAGTAMVGISQLGWGTGSISLENNAIQFKGIAFSSDPFTLGNSILYPAAKPGGWTPQGLQLAYIHERAHTYQYEVFGYRMIMDYGRELGSRGYYDFGTGVGNRFEEGGYRYQQSGGDSWVPF
ncbi:RHS repeat-associated core domain-containing protein [Mesorhizobium sp. M0633]|uniref:RHS repeat-associated core domain-containing protein n=1 Tax=Mesorhizobium sp. M0633 TaxID=2956977 RepID=UPI0033361532